jgi:DNA-binding Lrp family transcriptional regulator
MTKKGLDQVDRLVMGLLVQNARLSTAEIARQLGLSRSTAQERIARLEKEGEIVGYTARLKQDTTPGQIKAYIQVVCEHRMIEQIVSGLALIPEIKTVYGAAGAYTLLCMTQTQTTENLDKLLDRISKLPGVSRTQPAVLTSVRFDRR